MPKAEEVAVDRVDSAPSGSSSLEPAESMPEAIVRLASNPNVNVEALERIVRLQMEVVERQEARAAEKAFNKAFARMQPEIPEIPERGTLYGKGGIVISTYPLEEDIRQVVGPVLAKYGFSLSFESKHLEGNSIQEVGILRHRDGHSTRSEWVSDPDGVVRSNLGNALQAAGSAKSYGRRYVTYDLLWITSRGQDDDGRNAGAPEPPKGYDEWETDMASKADEGWDQLGAVWKESKKAYRDYATNYRSHVWSRLKSKALSKKKGGSE